METGECLKISPSMRSAERPGVSHSMKSSAERQMWGRPRHLRTGRGLPMAERRCGVWRAPRCACRTGVWTDAYSSSGIRRLKESSKARPYSRGGTRCCCWCSTGCCYCDWQPAGCPRCCSSCRHVSPGSSPLTTPAPPSSYMAVEPASHQRPRVVAAEMRQNARHALLELVPSLHVPWSR